MKYSRPLMELIDIQDNTGLSGKPFFGWMLSSDQKKNCLYFTTRVFLFDIKSDESFRFFLIWIGTFYAYNNYE